MKKWISALVISVVAGFAVWFFTQSSYSPFLGPKIELTNPEIPDRIIVGEEFEVSFRATNQRNRTERNCHGFVMLWPLERDGRETSGMGGETADGAMEVATARRAAAECETRTPNFFLGNLSGSSTQVVVDCIVHRAGDYRMIHGISCRSGENSKWQLDHQTFIEVQ